MSSSYNAGNSTTPLTADNSVGALQNGLGQYTPDPADAAASSKTSLGLYGEPYHAKTSYAQAYHLQLQYQLAANMVATLAYVGASARHLQAGEPSNTVSTILPPTANANTNSFFPGFATNGTFIARAAATNYNGIQCNVERRFSEGFSLLANYTYSKCLGDARDMLDNGIGSYRAPYVPGFGIAADYGLCDIDVRQIVHVSGIYELPFRQKQALSHFRPGRVGSWRLVDQLDLLRAGWATAYHPLQHHQRRGPGLQCFKGTRRKPVRRASQCGAVSQPCRLCQSTGGDRGFGNGGQPWRQPYPGDRPTLPPLELCRLSGSFPRCVRPSSSSVPRYSI